MSSKARYFSTMPSSPFALQETRVIAELTLSYGSRSEVRGIIHEGNLLNVRSDSNESKIFNYIYNRLSNIPDDLKMVIIRGEIADSKYVNLISIMSYDLLFKDFVFEVYNSKRMDSDPITDYDIMRYFERKSSEDDVVAGWGYETLFKLRRLYARVLFESGLLRNPTGMRETTTPIISIPVLDALVQSGFRDYVGATVGFP